MKTTVKLIGFMLFLMAGVWSVAAQDLIILRDGSVIEARVTEISQTEIRYRRFDFLDGPIFVIPAANVLSIRFEGGTTQTFSQPAPAVQPHTQTAGTRAPRTTGTAIDPNRFIFGISANAIGFALPFSGGGSGIRLELGRGSFNTEINLGGNRHGFVGFVTFNNFWHGRIGGFYLGGGLGVTSFGYWYWDNSNSREIIRSVSAFKFGLNTGYKFVTGSGLYFRTGMFLGYGVGWRNRFVFNPDISIGWTMR
ncbi:MAG: hypothetical protein FWC97_07135 [Treponema sp.]|nr:hypothetical protein [Treponema sp.]